MLTNSRAKRALISMTMLVALGAANAAVAATHPNVVTIKWTRSASESSGNGDTKGDIPIIIGKPIIKKDKKK